MDPHAEPLGEYGAGAYHDYEYGNTEAYTNPYPAHEDGMDAWAIQSDDDSEPESEEEGAPAASHRL
ncbi:hypothetical protein GLX27_004476 [Malassezia furfur]|uniref:Uncharacterized protein n=1 Tax=Malassezia furfur TaxID=55194 RepID=A0ABY8EWI2_MALFU|nr:hypothetical protein GLX27_004476 [Malassezia furfur]